MPYLFASLKVAITISLIGAIVAELPTGGEAGIGARLLTLSDIGEECLIAAGAVVPPGMKVPPRSVVMGVPGKVVRAVTDEELAETREICRRYRELAERYAAGEHWGHPSGCP